MKRRIRRTLVIFGVIASLILGVGSIRLAAELTAAAAPPPAPPVSMQALQAQLAAEQARSASLQQQLDDLMGATTQLTTALDSTESVVNADGATAAELRARLKDAQARLKLLTKLLKEASDRLAALGASGPTVPPGQTGGSGSGTGGGTNPAPTPNPTPKPTPTGSFALAISLDGGGGVVAGWTVCTSSGFNSYVLVRSLDSEIHYPAEDLDTVVATVTSNATTTATDPGAPSGHLWYRLYCLTRSGGETRIGATTSTVSIVVP